MIIIDAHEDIAWNMMAYGRDYTRSAHHTRRLEAGTPTPSRNDDALLGITDYRRGRVALVIGSLFVSPARFAEGDWDKLVYHDVQHAHRLYLQQIDLYERLCGEHPDLFYQVRLRSDLDEVLQAWDRATDLPPVPVIPPQDLQQPEPVGEPVDQHPSTRHEGEEDDHLTRALAAAPRALATAPTAGPPVGIVIGMEGAEAIREPAEIEMWYERGVRSIGLAWTATRYSGGSREPGPLTSLGYELLERMAPLNLALDISHMDKPAVLQALDVYPGPILASHSNAQALLRGAESNRHLSDQVLHALVERDAVIGVVGYNGFLKAGWKKGSGRREDVGLDRFVAQIDYICQVAGDARHVAIGTDFDGGFGWQSVPHDIDTIADLQKLVPLLAEKGYTQDDIAAVLSGNWIGLLRRVLPDRL